MKNIHIVASGLVLSAVLGSSTIAVADGHKKGEYKAHGHKDAKTMTEKSAVKDYLSEKEMNNELDALMPSARLVINIEGVDHDIKMSSNMGVTTLYVMDASSKDIEAIRKTYKQISNSSNFDIETISTLGDAPYRSLDERSDK